VATSTLPTRPLLFFFFFFLGFCEVHSKALWAWVVPVRTCGSLRWYVLLSVAVPALEAEPTIGTGNHCGSDQTFGLTTTPLHWGLVCRASSQRRPAQHRNTRTPHLPTADDTVCAGSDDADADDGPVRAGGANYVDCRGAALGFSAESDSPTPIGFSRGGLDPMGRRLPRRVLVRSVPKLPITA